MLKEIDPIPTGQRIIIENIIKDKLGDLLKLLPNMVRVSAAMRPEVADVSTVQIKDLIKKTIGPSHLAHARPRSIGGKVKKIKSFGRNYDKIQVNGKNMSKSRAAYYQIKFLIPHLLKGEALSPQVIIDKFPNIRIYPAMAIWVDEIQPKDKKRFYAKEGDLIKGKRGRMIALSTQWSYSEYKKMEKIAKDNGFVSHTVKYE